MDLFERIKFYQVKKQKQQTKHHKSSKTDRITKWITIAFRIYFKCKTFNCWISVCSQFMQACCSTAYQTADV